MFFEKEKLSTNIFFDVVQTTIIGNKGCNLLSVLDELNSGTLSDSRVRLLSFNTAAETEKQPFINLVLVIITCVRLITEDVTFSRGQCPWHEKNQQKVSSIHYQDVTSCTTCQPIFASFGGTWACVQLPFHVSYCKIIIQLNINTKKWS